jgi:hypothetical protein
MAVDLYSELGRSDPWVKAITPERIARAIEGFPLPLVEGWDIALLTTRIQDVAAFSREQTPQGDAEAKKELRKLAARAKDLRRSLERMGGTSNFATFIEVLQREYESQGTQQIDWNEDYKQMMHHPLKVIEEVLTRAASQICTQPKQAPGWQRRAVQERRVKVAIDLGRVFEEAYGLSAKSHNWAADFGKEHPWRRFYRRIYVELFPEDDRLNLTKVLHEAAKLRPQLEAVTRELMQDATREQNLRE